MRKDNSIAYTATTGDPANDSSICETDELLGWRGLRGGSWGIGLFMLTLWGTYSFCYRSMSACGTSPSSLSTSCSYSYIGATTCGYSYIYSWFSFYSS